MVRLNPREVGSFTLREAILAVKLELSGDDRVLTPAVHVKRGFREDESTSIRNSRVLKVRRSGSRLKSLNSSSIKTSNVQRNLRSTKVSLVVRIGRTMPVTSETGNSKLSRAVIKSTSILE